MFRHGEDVSIRILEPCDLAGRTLPDAEFVLVHAFILLKDDAALPQSGNNVLDIFNLPAENGCRYGCELLHDLRDDLAVSASENYDVGVLVIESKPESFFVEAPGALRIADPNESVYWKTV